MNTPADTTLHLQLEMADEEVKKAVEERVREIVQAMFSNGTVAFEIQKIVQQEVNNWTHTAQFRAAINNANLRLAQHLQHNIPY